MLDWDNPSKTWRELYEAALQEADPRHHLVLNSRAEQAIYKRFEQLEMQEHEERRSLHEALTNLANRRRGLLGWASSSSGSAHAASAGER